MWFTTKASGADYINVSMDVHRDQLFEVVKAITDGPDRPGRRRAQGAADTVDENTVRRLASGLTEGRAAALWADGRPPVCVVCVRTIQRGDRRSGNGLAFAVDPSTDEVVAVCRHCAAYSKDVESLTDYLRSGRVPRTSGDSAPAGWWSAAQVEDDRPVLAAVHVEAVPDGRLRGHVRDLIEAATERPRRAREGHDRACGDERLPERIVVDVADDRSQPAGGSIAEGTSECERGDRRVGTPLSEERRHDVDAVGGDGGVAVQGHGHGESSFGGCRCAGAAQANGQGVTEPTETPASLDDVVELLREVLDAMPGKPIGVKLDRSTRGGAWLIAADGAGEEDDTELDCEGPGAEGVDGGEDR